MPPTILTRLVVAVASTAASIIVAKYLEKYLSEKPLSERMDEWVDIAKGFQGRALDKVTQVADATKDKVNSYRDTPPNV